MAYQSLYRKYRPQTFADVMGQGHVVRTLQNALASGRVAHGYLFTGTRGTAKTTIARLLAKALNCESQTHPVTEPCNRCAACKSITAGSSIDVIEMDAASHRGVADIEEVRKSVGYGPMELRYKVFIIDEAHQLSSDAKDAFLKTLEEPPENVVFILATTEPQAIPITIRSRCQQFDFKRGSLAEIAARLRFVLDTEGVRYTSEAINLVARGAEGSYRDSLSLLEQVLAFTPKQIQATDVVAVLGTLDSDSLLQVTEAVANRDAARAFSLAGQLLDAGKEARTLLRTLAAHFRDLLLVQVGGPAVAVELTPDEISRLQQQAQAFTAPNILKAVDILNEAQGETRWNNQHRLLVELAFLKLMTIGDAPDTPLPVAPIVFSAGPPTDLLTIATPPPTFVSPSISTTGFDMVDTPALAAFDAHADFVPTPLVAESVLDSSSVSGIEESLSASYFADDTPTEDEYEPEDETVVLSEAPVVQDISIEPPEEPPVEPPYSGPGLFDDEPEFAAVAPPTVAEQTPIRTETTSNGFGLFDEEEVGVGLPAPDPFRQRAQAEEEVTFAPVSVSEAVHIVAGLPTGLAEEESSPHTDGEDALAYEWSDADEPADMRPGVLESPYTPPSRVRAQASQPVETAPVAAVPDEPDMFGMEEVYRAWPRFLTDARKISRRTELMMSKAHPERVYRNTIEIVFPGRFQYDMMSTPKAQEFVRKLFAKHLGVPRLAVKFVLAENAPPPPKRVTREKKQEFDPLTAIDALDTETPSGPVRGSGSSLSDFTVPEYRPPAVTVPSVPPARFATASRRPESSTPAPQYDTGFAQYPHESLEADFRENANHPALANPLVQDILEIFGGEIVSD